MLTYRKYFLWLKNRWRLIIAFIFAAVSISFLLRNNNMTVQDTMCTIGDIKCMGDQIQNDVINPLVDKIQDAGKTLDKASSTFVHDINTLSSTFKDIPDKMNEIQNTLTSTAENAIGQVTEMGTKVEGSFNSLLNNVKDIPNMFERKLKNFQLVDIIDK